MRSLILLFTLNCLTVSAQFKNVLISTDRNPNEPSIAINPFNPNEIVAAANTANFYLSNNGGLNWTEHIPKSKHGVWGDPVLMYDKTGSFYYLHLSNPPTGNWIDRIVIQRFDSLTTNYSTDNYVGLNGTKAQDKQWICTDNSNGNLYVTWTEFDKYGSSNKKDSSRIMFSMSVDKGETWTTAKKINKTNGDCIDDDNTVEGAVPAVGPNGELYVSWAGPDGLVFDKSLDNGNTWLKDDIFISDIKAGWNQDIPGINRANGLPVTICDLSYGNNRGTIYVNYTDTINGNGNHDVLVVKSKDGGNSWSNPIKVNDDQTSRDQFFTWGTVDQTTGYLYFVFYDRRNYDDLRTDVYMAVSKDGAQTFNNYKISESPFIPMKSVFFGDYTNISVVNGMIRPIWTRLDGDSLGIYTAILNSDLLLKYDTTLKVSKSIVELKTNTSIYPNPFSETALITFKIRQQSSVDLQVFDMLGNLVESIIKEQMLPSGKHIYKFNPNNNPVESGMYLFSLRINDSVVNKKIIFQNK